MPTEDGLVFMQMNEKTQQKSFIDCNNARGAMGEEHYEITLDCAKRQAAKTQDDQGVDGDDDGDPTDDDGSDGSSLIETTQDDKEEAAKRSLIETAENAEALFYPTMWC